MATLRSATLGTAGHIDHGKTALVERLTGTNTDRLAEERERGISIELGYAQLDLGDGLVLSVVDVPGHERFVRTMVAGSTGIDIALLCVASDDGVMPQTREHLAILALLGVETLVVALTKADLADAEGLELAALDAEDAVAEAGLTARGMVAVSARTGAGLAELREALQAAATTVVPRSLAGRARLPVDRVFSLRGIGTVVTGTLWSGTLRRGERIGLAPSGREARIRSLGSHDDEVEEIGAGRRVAACLVGVERREVRRGDVLHDGPALAASFRLDARLHAVPGGAGLVTGARVEVLHGTAVARARVVLLDGERLMSGSSGLAQLRLETPLAALRGDRVVVRTLGPPATAAGGAVLDPLPPRHAGGPAAVARLEALEHGDTRSVVLAAIGEGPASVDAAARRGLLDPHVAAAAIAELSAEGALVALDGALVIAAAPYAAIADAARATVTRRAAEHPLEPALPPSAVVPGGPGRDALTARLERDGVLVRDASGVRAPEAAARSEAAAEAARSLLERLAADPFAPPRLDDALADLGLSTGQGRALVAVLEREDRIVRLGEGLAVTREAYEQAVAHVRTGCEGQGTYTLAELRDATGTSRRYAQALLERMDRDGVTRRVGDARVLRRARS